MCERHWQNWCQHAAAQPQDMSLIQEPGAIILCLELELSRAMSVHEAVPYD